MNRNFTSRVLTTVLLGVLLGSYINHDQSKWSHLGRQAYISHETARFDKFMSPPKPVFLTIKDALVVALGVVGFYELTVLLFSAVLKTMRLWPGDRSSQDASGV
jgi:hypothetical protein